MEQDDKRDQKDKSVLPAEPGSASSDYYGKEKKLKKNQDYSGFCPDQQARMEQDDKRDQKDKSVLPAEPGSASSDGGSKHGRHTITVSD
jgi:hypothetical protein